MTEATLPDLKCATCGDPAVGVCNVILAQPMSLPYCARCVTQGIEAWPVIVTVVYMLVVDAADLEVDVPKPLTVEFVKANVAEWATNIIERSLDFHQKTWDDVLEDVQEDLDNVERPEWATEADWTPEEDRDA